MRSRESRKLPTISIRFMRAVLLLTFGAFSGIVLYVGMRRFQCSSSSQLVPTTTTTAGDGETANARQIVALLKWPGGTVPTTTTQLTMFPWMSALHNSNNNPSGIPSFHPQNKLLFQDLPPQFTKTFYNECSKGCHPFVRALRELGWEKVNAMEHGRLLLTWDNVIPEWLGSSSEVLSWQRYSHLPTTYSWAHDKSVFLNAVKEFSTYLPRTYQLHSEKDRKALQKALGSKKHKKSLTSQPWVFEPYELDAKPILVLPHELDKKHFPKQGFFTKYLCHVLPWGRTKRKFDVRVYFFVATLDPLLVFYHDGYVQTSKDAYVEGSYKDTDVHLMNYPGFKHDDSKHSFSALGQILNLSRNSWKKLTNKVKDAGIHPLQHVRNQMKEAVAEVVHGLAPTAFSVANNNHHDGWEVFAADFLIDDNLDVWLMSANDNIRLDEDVYSNLELGHDMYMGIVRILEEVWKKQEQPLKKQQPILPLESPGKWELIYFSDGERKQSFRYDYVAYDRKKNIKKKKTKPCAKIRDFRKRQEF